MWFAGLLQRLLLGICKLVGREWNSYVLSVLSLFFFLWKQPAVRFIGAGGNSQLPALSDSPGSGKSHKKTVSLINTVDILSLNIDTWIKKMKGRWLCLLTWWTLSGLYWTVHLHHAIEHINKNQQTYHSKNSSWMNNIEKHNLNPFAPQFWLIIDREWPEHNLTSFKRRFSATFREQMG